MQEIDIDIDYHTIAPQSEKTMNPERLFVSFAVSNHLHPDEVDYISWECGDGKFMTAGSGAICMWNADTGDLLETLKVMREDGLVSGGRMARVVWETGGRRMLIGNDVYDSKTGAVVQRIENDGLATWEHNGDRIAIAWEDAIFIWDSCTGQMLRRIDAPGYKSNICWAGGGSRIAVIGFNLQVWDPDTGVLLHEFISENEPNVRHLSCQPGGQRIASTGKAGLQIHDGISGVLLKTFPGYYQDIQWEPDGNRIAVLYDGGVQLIDAELGLGCGYFGGDSICLLGWEGNGRRIAVWDTRHNYLCLWNTRADAWADKELYELQLKSESRVEFLSWEPGGNRLLYVVEYSGIGLWNTETATLLSEGMRSRDPGTPCWRNECLMIWGYSSNEVAVKKISSGEVVSRHRISAGADLMHCSARFSPDNSKILAISKAGKLLVADAGSGEFRETMPVYPDRIQVYGWNNAASRVALAGDGGRVYLRDTPSGNFLRVLPRGSSRVTALCWEDDGDRIAVGTENGEIEVWNAHSGDMVVLLAGHIGPVNAMSWISNPPRIASAGEDGRLLIHDSASMKLLHSLNAESGPLYSASWESGGRRIAVGGDDTTIFIWQGTGGEENASFQIQVELEASFESGIARTPAGYAKCSGDPEEIRLIEKFETREKLRRTIWHPLGDLGPVVCNPDRFQAAFDGQLTRANLIEDIDALRKGSSEVKLEANPPLETAPDLELVVKAHAPEPELSLWKRIRRSNG